MKYRLFQKSAVLAALALGVVSAPAVSYAVEPTKLVAAQSQHEFVNDLFSRQWVTPNAQGSVEGSVVGLLPSEKAPVELTVFLVENGEVVQKVKTDSEGKFSLASVKPGTYSLVARGAGAIGAFSLQVIGAEAGKHLDSAIEVRVVKPAGKVDEILRDQTVPAYASRIDYPVDLSKDPIAASRTFGGSQAVKADDLGRLVGRLGTVDLDRDMSDMMVHVFQDGVEVASAHVTPAGEYAVEGLKPGVYGFVAVGESGFAATSFEFVTSESNAVGPNGEKLVGLFKHACRGMNVECVPCPAVTACEVVTTEVVTTEVIATESVACGEVAVDQCGAAPSCGCGFGWGGGGYGGGYGGGGGGGSGMGGNGWAGLAGIAGLAVVGGILASEDDGDGSTTVSN